MDGKTVWNLARLTWSSLYLSRIRWDACSTSVEFPCDIIDFPFSKWRGQRHHVDIEMLGRPAASPNMEAWHAVKTWYARFHACGDVPRRAELRHEAVQTFTDPIVPALGVVIS
jgi:hypothetical protein